MTGTALLSFGLVDGRPIFMDDQSDAYFQLGSHDEARFLQAIGNRSALVPGKTTCAQAFGLESVRIVRANPPAPNRSLLDQLPSLRRPSVREVLRAGRLMLAVRSEIARRPISEVLSGLAAPRPGNETGAPCNSIEEAPKFLAARRLIPLSPNCLSDSLALLHWLGHSPGLRLIFGVKLDPFAAHCWVQLHELLINERPDVIEAFRPVRVIECTPATR